MAKGRFVISTCSISSGKAHNSRQANKLVIEPGVVESIRFEKPQRSNEHTKGIGNRLAKEVIPVLFENEANSVGREEL